MPTIAQEYGPSDAPARLVKQKLLHCHTGAILVARLRSDAEVVLTAGGDARVCLWNVKSGELQQVIREMFHGHVQCVCWVDFEGRKDDGFVFGCANGTLHMYRWSAAKGSYVFVAITHAHNGRQVNDLHFSAKYRRVASIGDGTPQVWRVDDKGALSPMVNEPARRPFIGRTIHFCDEGASVLFTQLESHEV
ncbi:hypothetical protein FOMPIDRAFT_112900 [Fomitopsis schrenkii]|uniref:Uncharacterized protein n=1 Tax=Fomitopsis schrenkii TaxID=2126942 RepID=S8DT64_FOMSC|nr:hypothetical protein FOMPIDRAFT_112900 [Fomitopsis schrenkii]